MRAKKFSLHQLFFAFAILISGLLVLTCVLFWLDFTKPGATGFYGLRSFGRLVTNENANETRELYKINDTYAYLVNGETVSAVQYTKSSYLLCFVCGTYITTGNSVNLPLLSSNYLFAAYPNASGTYATLNLASSTYSAVDDLEPFLEEHGIQADQATPVSAEMARNAGPALSLEKDSCWSMTMAELILLGVSLLLGGLFWIRERKQKTSQ